MIMCTFKLIGVSDYELYRKFHGPKSPEKYAEYLAGTGTSEKSGERELTEESICPAPDFWIIREKHMEEEMYVKFFTDLWKKWGGSQKAAGRLIPHTYPAAARSTGCLSIHLPLPLLQKYHGTEYLAGTEKTGVSVHSVEEAREAERLGASYLTAGHIFATDCKAGLPPRGISFLNQVCDSVQIPVYAIGGIYMGNLHAVWDSRAAGACMMSAYMKGSET